MLHRALALPLLMAVGGLKGVATVAAGTATLRGAPEWCTCNETELFANSAGLGARNALCVSGAPPLMEV